MQYLHQSSTAPQLHGAETIVPRSTLDILVGSNEEILQCGLTPELTNAGQSVPYAIYFFSIRIIGACDLSSMLDWCLRGQPLQAPQ